MSESVEVEALELGFLRLLTSGAPVPAFQAAFFATRDTLTGDDLRAAEERLTMALAIRELLEEQRRRSRELNVLVDTAADLATLRNSDTLLNTICERARALLGADAAWLTYDDPDDGDTYTRATCGIVSDEFRAIRLARCSGLGGLIAGTGKPQLTADYLTDTRFTHTPDFDAAVAAEGFRAMLGVPVTRADEVVGVVLAGTRGPRRFTHDDIDLLESLGALATIALENSRLYDESQRALEHLRKADERLLRDTQAIQQSAELDSRLMTLVLDGAGLGAVTDAIAEILDGSLTVIEYPSNALTTAGKPQDELDRTLMTASRTQPPPTPPDLEDGLRRARHAGRTVTLDTRPDHVQRLISPMRAAGQPLGELILARPDVTGAEHFLNRATTLVSLVLVNTRSIAETEARVRDELVCDIIRTPPTDPTTLKRRAARLYIELEQPHAVVVARPTGGPDRWTSERVATFAQSRGGISGEVDGAHVVLVPGTEPEAAAALVERCMRSGSATTGAAGPAVGAPGIAAAYMQAQHTVNVLLALDRGGATSTARALGFFGLVFTHAAPGELTHFVDDTLGTIITYDTEHNTCMLNTIEAYFDTAGHMANTALALHIHVNTLYQRIERITLLLGPTWRDPDQRLQIHLAIRLHRFATKLDAITHRG